MMRSMYSGVSGLKVHQLKMDVIGNNIANVNTVGFKGQKVTFSEAFSQTIKGASSPQGGRGGTNPQQVGLGANVATVNVIHTKGSTQRTDNPTDLMIDGNGFFVLSNDPNGQNRFYTRAGNFAVDKSGYLVAPNGYKVLGSDFKPIQINRSETKKATATEKIVVNGNLNSSESDYNTTVDIYDSLGDTHILNINFIGDPIGMELDPANLPGGPTTDPKFTTTSPAPDGFYEAGSDQDYYLRRMSVTAEDASGLGVGERTNSSTFAAGEDVYALFNEDGEIVDLVQTNTDPKTWDPNDATTTDINGAFSGNLNIDLEGADEFNIPVNRTMFFKDAEAGTDGTRIFTQYSQASDAKGQIVEGNAAGAISSFSISSKGEIVGVFTNGEQKTLGVIGLADFDNPPGLEKIGGNMYKDTANSGTPKYGNPSTGSFGSLSPGALEMSNVDLSQEFTDMITTQRGFQANSRVISTTDEILQELVNLKR